MLIDMYAPTPHPSANSTQSQHMPARALPFSLYLKEFIEMICNLHKIAITTVVVGPPIKRDSAFQVIQTLLAVSRLNAHEHSCCWLDKHALSCFLIHRETSEVTNGVK